jgi:hypothetical protein
MVTASSPAASASSGRPRSASRFDRLSSDLARSGRTRPGGTPGLLVGVGGFLERGQRVLRPACVAQQGRQVVQRRGPAQAGTRETSKVPPNAAPRSLPTRSIVLASGIARDEGEKGGVEHVRAVYPTGHAGLWCWRKKKPGC